MRFAPLTAAPGHEVRGPVGSGHLPRLHPGATDVLTSASMMDRMIRCAAALMSEAQVRSVRVTDLAERMELPEEAVRTMFADDQALAEASGTFGGSDNGHDHPGSGRGPGETTAPR